MRPNQAPERTVVCLPLTANDFFYLTPFFSICYHLRALKDEPSSLRDRAREGEPTSWRIFWAVYWAILAATLTIVFVRAVIGAIFAGL
jgi:hypothetical protein